MAAKKSASSRKRDARPATRFVEVTERNAVAIVVLNRPDVHNAFNGEVIAELTATFAALDADNDVRASPEGKEGVAAFLGKRKAAWVPPAPPRVPNAGEE